MCVNVYIRAQTLTCDAIGLQWYMKKSCTLKTEVRWLSVTNKPVPHNVVLTELALTFFQC